MVTGKRAWIYARIDAPEDYRCFLKGQKEELCNYAKQMGFTVAGVSSDTASGIWFDRPGLAQVTAAAEIGRFDILLVKKFDRIGRDFEQTITYLRHLHELGIKVHSPLEGEIDIISNLEQHNAILGMNLE